MIWRDRNNIWCTTYPTVEQVVIRERDNPGRGGKRVCCDTTSYLSCAIDSKHSESNART